MTAPIVGATKLEQLDQLIAGPDLALTDEDARLVEGPYQPHPCASSTPLLRADFDTFLTGNRGLRRVSGRGTDACPRIPLNRL